MKSRLSGTLPGSLWPNSNLTEIHLYGDQLYGEVPLSFKLPNTLEKIELVGARH